MKKFLSTTALTALALSGGVYADTDDRSNIVEDSIEDITVLNKSGLYKPHFALMGGVSDPVENGYQSAEMIALEVGYQVMVPLALGLEISTQEFENNNEADINQTQLFLKGSYNFGGNVPVIKSSYVGVGVGVVQENSNNNVTYGAVMPNMGFDILLTESLKNLSLGANVRYTATSSNDIDNFALNGVVKYWF